MIAAHAAAGDRVQWVAALFGLCLFAIIGLDLRRRIPATVGLAPAETWFSGRAPASWRNGVPSWTSPALTVARIWLVVAAIAVIVVVIQAGAFGRSGRVVRLPEPSAVASRQRPSVAIRRVRPAR
jgi:hypothetical protein